MFWNLKMNKWEEVIFGGDQHGRVIGSVQVSLKPSLSIDNVHLVDGLKHNLLSINQLCDSEYSVVFNKDQCIVKNKDETRIIAVSGEGNLYKIYMDELLAQKSLLPCDCQRRSLDLTHKEWSC